ncbi:MAG: GntR family transcriptional regulator [Nitrospirota bacterium]|nr:GntR family transcriptional regulator [Nitrospirota bacterium]
MIHSETSLSQSKTVDRFNQEKLYIQLTRILLEKISSGNWKLNDRIPSEDELSRTYHISKITVRQAVNNLTSDGYLMKIQGKGTFVTSVLPVVGVAMRTIFTEEMFGKEVKAEKELLFRGVKEPAGDIRSYLKTDGDIYYILSRRLLNGHPAYVDESFIPYSLTPDIHSLDIAGASLYFFLQEKALKKIFKVIQTVEVSQATGDSARHLDLDEGVSVLVVHRLLISSDSTPVAYTKLQGRSDRYKFQSEFERLR